MVMFEAEIRRLTDDLTDQDIRAYADEAQLAHGIPPFVLRRFAALVRAHQQQSRAALYAAR